MTQLSSKNNAAISLSRVNALCEKYKYVPIWKTDYDEHRYACVEFSFPIVPLQERPKGYFDPMETFYIAAKRIKGVIAGQMYSSNGIKKSGVVTIKIK